MTDEVYRIPVNPYDIIGRCPQNRFSKHIADRNDCDDRSRIFRGWMSEKGFGNVLAMSCKIKVPTRGSHSVIAFLNRDEIIFGEPKQGMIVQYKGATIQRLIA